MRKSIHSRHSQAVSEALKAMREKAGLTQRELCRLLGREHSFVSKYEQGERRIDVAEFFWICQACGVSAEGAARAVMRELAALGD